jgi:copper chaperone
MLRLKVDGMSCAHCVAAITGAVREVAPGARATVDLAAGRVEVTGAGDPAAIRRAIEAEGYAVALLPEGAAA